ncbi:hypothetical protein DFP72DRAFT_102300 [Ephemerocybe angulata]|uniref:C2H2-type domain-containing protein n=1 Tax=Ephemerocybe angulata TaxID=980116 RepID=A0A8H6MDS0_9AGAR|nr:hypothetical protein DFP72DRAFT_102300 [Tulosesus angulatus]
MNPPRIQINPALNYQAGEPIWGTVPGQRVLYHPPPSASAEDVMMHGEPHPIHTAYHLPPAEHNHAPVHHPHFPVSLPPFAFSHSNSPSTSSSSYTLPSLPHILIPHGNQALAGTSRMQTKQLPSSDFEASADIRLPTIDESKPDFTDPSSASTSSSPNKAAKPRAPKASTGAPKPFKCEFPGCNATFTRKNDVQRHMKSASAHRNFEQEAKGDFDDKKCPRCGRILSREDSARRHFESGACGKRELPSEQVLKGKRVAGGPKAVQDTNSRSRSRT